MGDFMGVIGGAVVSTQILKIDSFAYWKHTRDFVDSLDIFAGRVQELFLRRGDCPDQLPSGVQLRARSGGRRPRGDRGLRVLVHRDLVPRLRPRAGLEQCVPDALASVGRLAMSGPERARGRRSEGLDRAARRQHSLPVSSRCCGTSTWRSSRARRFASSVRAAAARR